jgi:hypothetical protein
VALFADFKCAKCSAEQKRKRGCREDAPEPYWHDLDDLDEIGQAPMHGIQKRCPRRFIYEDPEWWYEIVTAYNGYQNGFLPAYGGLEDQPALFTPIIAFVGQYFDKCEDVKRKAEERLKQSAGNAGSVSLLGKN